MAHRKVCSYILKENVDEIPKKSKYFDGSAIFWLIAIALVTVSPAVLSCLLSEVTSPAPLCTISSQLHFSGP